MTSHSLWLRRMTVALASLGALCALLSTPAMADPTSKASSRADHLLRFFPSKPVAVFRSHSLRLILTDLQDLAQRAGFGAMIAPGRQRAFHMLQKVLNRKQPIASFREMFSAVGLPEDPSIAVAAVQTPTAPGIGAIVVLSLKDPKVVNQIVTQTIPALRDRNRFRSCQRTLRSYQRRLSLKIARDGKKEYTLSSLGRVYRSRSCPAGVTFKVEGDRVVSPELANGLPGFRKAFGKRAKVSSLGKAAQLVRLARFTYAVVDGRYMVWATSPTLLRSAVRSYTKTSSKTYLAAGFQKHLSATSRFQMYLNYMKYMKLMLKLNNMVNSLNPKMQANTPPQLRQLQNLSKQLQGMSLAMSKGYDAMWLDARAKKDLYRIYSVVTTQKPYSPLVSLFLQARPAPLRSLSLLPRSTVMVISMNLVQLYFKLASVLLQQMSNKALGQFVLSIGQWQAMFGDELTLAVASSRRSPVQVMLLLEVKQAQQLEALLGSLTAMLGASGKSPLKTVTHGNTLITYLFKGRKPRGKRRSPADRLPPGELAWAFVDNHFVLTYQMTNRPNFRVIKRMLDPKHRQQTSIMNNPTFVKLLKQTGQTNFLMYIGMPRLLRAVQMFAPPLPQVQQALRAASTIRYLFGEVHNVIGKNKMEATSDLGLAPAPTPTTAPKK